MTDNNVLGQRTRKVNIDRGLAERLNKETEEEIGKRMIEAQKRKSKQTEDASLANPPVIGDVSYGLILCMDVFRADQDEWINHWNNDYSNYVMMSASLFYDISSFFRSQHLKQDAKGPGSKFVGAFLNKSLLKDFRSCLDHDVFLTSTRIHYLPEGNNQYEAEITHNYGSNNPHLTTKEIVEIPAYPIMPGGDIEEVMMDPKGRKLLQALFGTTDDSEAIMKNLEFLTKKVRQDIRIETPSLAGIAGRNKRPESPVSFSRAFNGTFYINLGNDLNTEGHCYGAYYVIKGDAK